MKSNLKLILILASWTFFLNTMLFFMVGYLPLAIMCSIISALFFGSSFLKEKTIPSIPLEENEPEDKGHQLDVLIESLRQETDRGKTYWCICKASDLVSLGYNVKEEEHSFLCQRFRKVNKAILESHKTNKNIFKKG